MTFSFNNKSFVVDFEKLRYQKISRDELLLKAVGLKKYRHLNIVDLTAGFGSDAYLLYRAGCTLQLVERSKTVAGLLQVGLKRVGCDLPLFVGEAKDFLQRCLEEKVYPDVIYFDPIFPEKTKTALAKKSAQLLRYLVGEDIDAKDVFEFALTVAKKRVVVKRPLHGNTINQQKPNIVFKGKSIRFDVYVLV